MGYDVVGIVSSDRHRPAADEGSELDVQRDRVGEKWARRDLENLTVDPAVLSEAAAGVPGGVAAVCAMGDGRPVGMVAAFGPISEDPPMLSLRVSKASTTWTRLRELHLLGVSLLSETQGLVYRTMSTRRGDRFSGVPWQTATSGAVFVHGASTWAACTVREQLDAGDHLIVLLTVHGLQVDRTAPPLVLGARRHRLPRMP